MIDETVRAILRRPTVLFDVRPSTYPLPVTAEGVAYWELNLFLIGWIDWWRAWQLKKPMSEIIPRINALRDRGE